MSLFFRPAPLKSDADPVVQELKARKRVILDHQTKTAEEYIAEVPIIEVDGDTAVCDGGDGPLGHPIEFIQLNQSVNGREDTCKYCGLRFKKKEDEHHH